MENAIIQRLKDSIARQRQSLSAWLNGSSIQERQIRLGPASEEAVERHIHVLDTALQQAEANTLGLCTVCHEHVETSRLEMDYTASVCIDHLTGEERTRLENELELSQKVQRALLPHQLPSIKGLDIAAFSRPANIVGGDYFDFVRMANGAHAIVIADVMGKGMPASMLMASLQASLKIIAPESSMPSDVVSRLNRLFVHNIQLTKFVTFVIACYDEQTRSLTYVNAGHNPPILTRADGTIEYLAPTGAAIGLVEDADFAERTIGLQPGDRLLLYTDGVVEARKDGGEFFGEDRLLALVRETSSIPSQNVITSLRNRLQMFGGGAPPADDTTVIAVRVV
jgi:sigma-B regulation protein RsbU (phosphoserine phosphatase)